MSDKEEKLNIGAEPMGDNAAPDSGGDNAETANAAEGGVSPRRRGKFSVRRAVQSKKEKKNNTDKKNKRNKTKKADGTDNADKKGRKRKIITAAAVIAAILVAAIGISVIIDSHSLEKSFYQVKSNKVTDNIRIVCLSDMHLKEFGKDNEYLIHEVDKLSPDIITLVGDMNMETKPDKYDVVINLCVKLNEIAPVYYSLGNHEIDAMLFKNSNIYKDVKKAGIKIMNNETDTVTIGGTTMDIIGLTQNPKEFEEYGKAFFDKAMSATDNFKLVLTHYPEQFFGTLDDYNIDLALAGHAHGGQVRLPWIGGLYAADQGFFPQLCDGYHEIGNSRLLITRGLGKSGICPRIFNKPEIMVVDIGWY